MTETAPSPWSDALRAATLLAIDPVGLGGAHVCGPAGPARDAWLARLRAMLPAGTPWRTLPSHIGDERLLGGLDLAATLRAGTPIAQRGLLADADGGLLLLPMAERMDASLAARLTAAMDRQEVLAARDGITLRQPARLSVLALDEGLDAEERAPPALCDRLAFHLALGSVPWREAQAEVAMPDPEEIAQARARLAGVQASDEVLQALCAACVALGIGSARAPWLAWCAARAAAALDGSDEVMQDHADAAARLVLAHRATRLPAEAPPEAQEDEAPAPPEAADAAQDEPDEADRGEEESPDDDAAPQEPGIAEDQVIAAAKSAIEAGLLARLQADGAVARSGHSQGRHGASQRSKHRGRPTGTMAGDPRGGARLSLIETLRAAAPWQAWRQGADAAAPRMQVRPEDFRIRRFRRRTQTTTVFAVDASGSSALHRLAEAKGAVELLLADCYVRRDQVAVVAFRGRSAELLLPATRSLVRAKRALADLPGGGGTPLAAGLDAAWAVAEGVRRRGDTPLVVLLTDGRGNIARDGTADRAAAESDALLAAGRWRASGFRSLVIDTSPRAEPRAQALAERMQATYLPLPHAQAAALSVVVRQAAATAGREG